MSTEHPARLASECVRQIAPYTPGKPVSEVARELGLTDIIKLASNENPLGAGPAAMAAMQAALAESAAYPDGSGHALKQALAARLGVAPAQLTLGNGSNDVLVLLAEAFLTPGTDAVFSQYCFAVYPLAVQATGARAIVVPALPADHPRMPLGHDLDAMRAAVTAQTRLVFVANPNNPTGTWVGAAALEAFVAGLPSSTLVVLDEAYFEYARAEDCGDGIAWLARHPRLVVVRTFSKAYGLAGLRVGYAASHPEVADVLNRIRQPFNVNSIALEGARAALADDEHLVRSVALVQAERPRLARELASRGFTVLPSAGNFLLAHIGSAPRAAALNDHLLRGGVIVRPVGNYGLAEYLRITIGRPQENARLLELIDAWPGDGAR
ncbi:MAG TPA: histidinol-phosphate transaminase [Steroidobacteraceae bacterium]|nr:histidinol-phosphate transaminase [Steroidobacteraceae bacterium]